ncbi:hypothetical protein NBRC116602_27050 [Hyphomicrobiales bacterium 4NK60-0047b]
MPFMSSQHSSIEQQQIWLEKTNLDGLNNDRNAKGMLLVQEIYICYASMNWQTI